MLISICAGPSRSNWDLIAKLSSGQIAPRRPGERQLDSKNEETSKINRISQYTANTPRDINHLLSVTFCTQMTRTPIQDIITYTLTRETLGSHDRHQGLLHSIPVQHAAFRAAAYSSVSIS